MACGEMRRSSPVSIYGSPPRERRAATGRSGHTRSGTRCSARCCTSPPAGSARARAAPQNRRRPRTRAGRGRPVAAAELAMHFERARDPATALRYYAEAAEAALAHLSPAECIEGHRARLALLDRRRTGRERDALEITLSTLWGVAATQRSGRHEEARVRSAGLHVARRRAAHPMRGRLLHGFGFVLCLRAEYAEALAVADRAEALAPQRRSGAGAARAPCRDRSISSGPIAIRRGGGSSAVLAPLEALMRAGTEFLADPQVTLLALLACHCFILA